MTAPGSALPASSEGLLLRTLRCIGYTSPARLAATTGLDESDVESELIDLAVAGLVTYDGGGFGGWGLTAAGRTADAERVEAELAATGARAAVVDAYDRFLVLNPELLDLCTAWQMRAVNGVVTLNDHTDPGYDTRVLDRLIDLDQRAAVVCADVSAALPRFRRYPAALSAALARVKAGERDYVTDNLESYHNIWFQLHEDLLATLGIPR